MSSKNLDRHIRIFVKHVYSPPPMLRSSEIKTWGEGHPLRETKTKVQPSPCKY